MNDFESFAVVFVGLGILIGYAIASVLGWVQVALFYGLAMGLICVG